MSETGGEPRKSELVVRKTANGPRAIPRVDPRTMAQKLRAFSEVPPEEFDGVLANARSCADVIALSTIAGAMDPRVDNHLGYVREFSDRAFGRPTQAHEAPSEHRVKSERRAGLPSSELRTLEVLLRKHGKFDEANAVAAELAQEDSPDA